MKFLTATWHDLLLANYEVDPAVLEPFVPDRTTLDKFQDRVFISLVAFLFEDTAVFGLPAWMHRRFEEANLRFYVKPDRDPTLRGVTFIKEIVPSTLIPFVANNLFHENYVNLPMSHKREADSLEYSWGRETSSCISARLNSDLSYPEEGSLPEFITEHYWGYAKGRGATLEYEVTHPQWRCCSVEDYQIDVDFEATYGERFSFLDNSRPSSVLYAEGSSVAVSFPRRV